MDFCIKGALDRPVPSFIPRRLTIKFNLRQLSTYIWSCPTKLSTLYTGHFTACLALHHGGLERNRPPHYRELGALCFNPDCAAAWVCWHGHVPQLASLVTYQGTFLGGVFQDMAGP
jgi:hypothetical protein